MVKVPALFCSTPSTPPPEPPVTNPPWIVWLVLPTSGATMMAPSTPSVFVAPIATSESAAAVYLSPPSWTSPLTVPEKGVSAVPPSSLTMSFVTQSAALSLLS